MIWSKFRRRGGISELMATVLTIAITLIAGFAVFGYINGQAANSESALGGQNASNINFLNERESITFVSFASNEQQMYVWILNTGKIDLEAFTLFVSGPMCAGPSCSTGPLSTFSCSYGGVCSWVSGGPPIPCGTLAPSTPIKASTSTTQSSPQSILISVSGCNGVAPAYFASNGAQSNAFTVTFQGQFNSQASVTKGN